MFTEFQNSKIDKKNSSEKSKDNNKKIFFEYSCSLFYAYNMRMKTITKLKIYNLYFVWTS